MAKYYISFDTKDAAPNLKAVTVELKHELIRDMNKGLAINLIDDPLYPALVAYVDANRGKK